jgi:glycosyltransferase involved in cell wall biosynthesis
VHTCALDGALHGAHPELTRLVADLSPDVMIGVGHIAAKLMKHAAPEKPVLFLTSGCRELKLLVERAAVKDFLDFERRWQRAIGRPSLLARDEIEAVNICDLVVSHSDMTLELYRRFFPSYAGKLHREVVWFAEWIHEEACRLAPPTAAFAEREIDVLFVSSSWQRPEKNYPLVERIAARLGGASIHVVGEVDRDIPAATHHGPVSHAQALGLMGRARTLACPSAFDAAPGILFEAAALGCNIVASRNCGNWRICHPNLLVESCTARGFATAIHRSLSRSYPNNLDWFLRGAGAERLASTIAVM